MTTSTQPLTLMFAALALLLVPRAQAQDAGYDAPAHLKPLEWMVGEWTGDYPLPEGATAMVTRTAHWVHDRKFLHVELDSQGGAEKWSLHAVYFWDPIDRKIRIWSMASTGSWSQGVVEAEEGMNRIRFTGITRQGQRQSATGTFKRTGADSMTVQWTDVKIDGQPRPDGPASTLRRK